MDLRDLVPPWYDWTSQGVISRGVVTWGWGTPRRASEFEGQRRLITLVCAGWLPQDKSPSGATSVYRRVCGCDRARLADRVVPKGGTRIPLTSVVVARSPERLLLQRSICIRVMGIEKNLSLAGGASSRQARAWLPPGRARGFGLGNAGGGLGRAGSADVGAQGQSRPRSVRLRTFHLLS